MGSVGGGELLLIFLVILLVFGAKRIPEIARGLGRGLREFKEATRDIQRELTLQDPPPIARRSALGQGASPRTPASATAPSSSVAPGGPGGPEAPQRSDEAAGPPASEREAERSERPTA